MMDYLNGVWTDGPAQIRADDRGLLLGDGVFETLAVRGGRVWRIATHLARLRHGADIMGIRLPENDQTLGAVLREAADRNGVETGLVRLTLTRGPATGGLASPDNGTPTILVTARSRAVMDAPIDAVIARTTRRNETSPLAAIKSTSYLDGILAAREAQAQGADEALLLNTQGRLAESTIANLFLVIDGQLVTPPVNEGALPGVMRADIIGHENVHERPLSEDDLWRASEAMLTNSGGVRPLVGVDGRAVGEGVPGPVTTRLQTSVWQTQEDQDG
jgi:branched-chain amino acid aminotransferase